MSAFALSGWLEIGLAFYDLLDAFHESQIVQDVAVEVVLNILLPVGLTRILVSEGRVLGPAAVGRDEVPGRHGCAGGDTGLPGSQAPESIGHEGARLPVLQDLGAVGLGQVVLLRYVRHELIGRSRGLLKVIPLTVSVKCHGIAV